MRNNLNSENLFRQIAAISAIISAPVALSAWVLVLAAIDFDVDSVSNLTDVITFGAPATGFMHVAWAISDVFGLLLAPAVLYLWHWLKPRIPKLITLYTFFGLVYILTRAVTASLMGGATIDACICISLRTSARPAAYRLPSVVRYALLRCGSAYMALWRHMVARYWINAEK